MKTIGVPGENSGKRSVIQYWLRTGAMGKGNPSSTLSKLLHAPAAFTTIRAGSAVPSSSTTPVTAPA